MRRRAADWPSRSAGNPDETPRASGSRESGRRNVTCSCMPRLKIAGLRGGESGDDGRGKCLMRRSSRWLRAIGALAAVPRGLDPSGLHVQATLGGRSSSEPSERQLAVLHHLLAVDPHRGVLDREAESKVPGGAVVTSEELIVTDK